MKSRKRKGGTGRPFFYGFYIDLFTLVSWFQGQTIIVVTLIPIVLFTPVQCIDPGHLFIGESEVVQLRVFPDVVRVTGAGDDHHALL